MGRVIAMFVAAIAGALIGYLVATEYLAFRLSRESSYTYLITDFRSIRTFYPELLEHVWFIIGGGAIFGFFCAGALVSDRLTTYGTSRFQTRRDLRKNKFFEKPGRGFMIAKTSRPRGFGRLLCSVAFPHCMLIAPTGRGKGVGFVIPNLLEYKGSVVVLDVKGENFLKTARARQALGDKVLRFAPVTFNDDSEDPAGDVDDDITVKPPEGFKSASNSFNPLLRISRLNDPDHQMFELDKLAGLFLTTSNDKNQGLLDGGIIAFKAACLLAIQRGKPTLGEVYRLIYGVGSDRNAAYLQYAEEMKREDGRILWEQTATTDDETLSRFLSILNTSGLGVWSNGRVDKVTQGSDIDFSTIRKVPQSIYLTINSADIPRCAGLIRLFFSDLVATLEHHEPGKSEPWPVMIVLDEFHKLGKMSVVADAITTLRSFGGNLAIITQTVPVLDDIYGRNGRLSLEGNSRLKMYMTPSDEMTIDAVSAACGMKTKKVKTRNWSDNMFGKATTSERSEEEPLLKPDDARRMSLTDVVIVADGMFPIKAKTIRYFKDRKFKKVFYGQDLLPWPQIPEIAQNAVKTNASEDSDVKAETGDEHKDSAAELRSKNNLLEGELAAAKAEIEARTREADTQKNKAEAMKGAMESMANAVSLRSRPEVNSSFFDTLLGRLSNLEDQISSDALNQNLATHNFDEVKSNIPERRGTTNRRKGRAKGGETSPMIIPMNVMMSDLEAGRL